jgi:hypothetical protein
MEEVHALLGGGPPLLSGNRSAMVVPAGPCRGVGLPGNCSNVVGQRREEFCRNPGAVAGAQQLIGGLD